eukprot:TRINITY_DN93991_c0_g1_i1.p1 TRINITY_DN93991_c0_g1~~TRINITY_DN93991_c0_g1_i1.p1  ORF type:complete len:261 (-),score=50.16 TRINITY_DN93991_c0_g1_i1:12-794(-)
MTKRKRKACTDVASADGPPQKKVHVVDDRAVEARLRGSLPPFPEGFPREAPKGDELNALMQLEFHGKVHLVKGANEESLDWRGLEAAEVLGLDTETRPVFQKGQAPNPTALIQLATQDECWIFQLLAPNGVSDSTKKRLQVLLESSGIVKVGVGLHDDFLNLHRFHMPSMKSISGVLDLQDIVRPYGLRSTSLRSLAATFLNKRIAKSQQTSDWAQANLSQAQIWYAAADAWAGWRLHHTMRGLFDGSEAWAPGRQLTIS